MAHVITDDCLACGACQAECPVVAISVGVGKFVIDPELCIGCTKCARNCPVGAIPTSASSAAPASPDARNMQLRRDKDG